LTPPVAGYTQHYSTQPSTHPRCLTLLRISCCSCCLRLRHAPFATAAVNKEPNYCVVHTLTHGNGNLIKDFFNKPSSFKVRPIPSSSCACASSHINKAQISFACNACHCHFHLQAIRGTILGADGECYT